MAFWTSGSTYPCFCLALLGYKIMLGQAARGRQQTSAWRCVSTELYHSCLRESSQSMHLETCVFVKKGLHTYQTLATQPRVLVLIVLEEQPCQHFPRNITIEIRHDCLDPICQSFTRLEVR